MYSVQCATLIGTLHGGVIYCTLPRCVGMHINASVHLSMGYHAERGNQKPYRVAFNLYEFLVNLLYPASSGRAPLQVNLFPI